MRGRTLLVASLLLLLASSLARADGKVFSVVEAVPTIPDQQALIHYAEGVETLVIETRFVGKGDEFAWVVPVPAVPTVSKVTSGLFPTLRHLLRPTIGDPSRWYVLSFLLLVTVLLLHTRNYGHLASFLIVVFLIFSILVPSLGPSRMSAEGLSSDDVIVHERSVIGAYDVATLTSSNPDSLLEWLASNGFKVDPAMAPVARVYVNEGWSFVAARLRPSVNPGEAITPHPLAFTFPTTRPVYPLRLTGVGNQDHCVIDLYVFGSARAQIPGFAIRHCERPLYAQVEPNTYRRPENVTIVHPQLSMLARQAPVLTHLRADLNPASMNADAYIDWQPVRETRTILYSRAGAATYALNVSVIPACVAALILYELRRSGRLRKDKSGRLAIAMLAITFIGASVTYGLLPRTNTYESSRMRNVIRNVMRSSVGPELKRRAEKNPDRASDLAWLTEQAAELTDRHSLRADVGDSPGGYCLRQEQGAIQFVWYDDIGAEHVVDLTSPRTTSAPGTAGSSAPASQPHP